VYVQTLEKMGVAPENSSAEDRRLDTMLKALSDWPLDEPLKLGQLAAGMKLSERRVHDLLRSRLGMTAQVWMERRRLEVARQRLAGEGTALKEIAFALGFKHPPHFTAWFKRHTGMTPTGFRDAGGVSGA
jgi:AraC-like DNA-binding protein